MNSLCSSPPPPRPLGRQGPGTLMAHALVGKEDGKDWHLSWCLFPLLSWLLVTLEGQLGGWRQDPQELPAQVQESQQTDFPEETRGETVLSCQTLDRRQLGSRDAGGLPGRWEPSHGLGNLAGARQGHLSVMAGCSQILAEAGAALRAPVG